jgi:23S rRNA-/tRNA-specific pseudouridylate synthase
VYGRRDTALAAEIAQLKRQALHAQRLELEHPVSGRRLAWLSPLPRDLERVLASLRAGDAR